MLDKRLAECQGMQLNLEQQIFTLEKGNTNTQVVGALSEARDEMKRIAGRTNVEDIEDIRDSLDEATADQEDITSILSEPMGDAVADDELEDEFADMMAEIEGEDVAASLTSLPGEATKNNDVALPDVDDLPEPAKPIKLPAVVTDEPVMDKDEADELAELNALMA